MSDIDWNKAPAGATHYMRGCTRWERGFWKREGAQNYFWSLEEDRAKEWRSTRADPFRTNLLIERTVPEAWDGQGLPPVGTVCEGLDGCNRWHRCRIVHHSIGEHPRALAATGDDESGIAIFHGFRTICTSEQIAAVQRRNTIEMMVMCHCPVDIDPKIAFRICSELYDAGYRKQDVDQ